MKNVYGLGFAVGMKMNKAIIQNFSFAIILNYQLFKKKKKLKLTGNDV